MTAALMAFWRLLRQAPLARTLVVLLLMVLVSLTEGIGLLLLVPLLEWLGNPQHPRLPAASWGAWPGWVEQTGPAALLAGFVCLVALRSAVQYGREQWGQHLQHELVDTLRQRCFAALLRVEWRWLTSTRHADHANLLLNDVNRVGVGLYFGINLLASAITLQAYLLTATALSWPLTLVALCSGTLVFGLLAGQRRHALQLGHNLSQASRAMQGNVQESLAGIKLAKILGTEHRHLDHFVDTTARLRAQQLQFAASTGLSRAGFQLAGAMLLAAYVYLGLTWWQTPVPVLLTLVLIFSRLIPLLMSAHQQLHHWLHALPALQQTEQLLADCEAAAEPQGHTDTQAELPAVVRHAIELRGVSFCHVGRDRPAVAQLDLTLPARTTTAIMGHSGAGKSTLADLLMGLLQPQQGEIRVDGVPISGALRKQWRRQVAYVPQECFLFHDSIRHNLLWSEGQATEADLRLALQRAAADFVFDLPQGLDTVVGDGGMRLSGGERQRIALARALLKRPSLLILDEATSALDTDNEARIRRAIEQLHGDLTVVIIGHRLPTLEHADQVLVLQAGTVKAQGSWADVRQHLATSTTHVQPIHDTR